MICPSEATVGTNARLTPNCLNSIVVWLFCWATGMGNSPPTRKLAASPLIAVRFGCARMCTSSSWASASMMALKLPPRLRGLCGLAIGAIRFLLAFSVSGREHGKFADAADVAERLPVDAQLTDQVAAHLRDAHAQIHLDAGCDGQPVVHGLPGWQIAANDLHHAIGIGRAFSPVR